MVGTFFSCSSEMCLLFYQSLSNFSNQNSFHIAALGDNLEDF